MTAKYIENTGRRKTATARVRIFPGTEVSTVNGRPLENYVDDQVLRARVTRPFDVCELKSKYYFTAVAKGGGVAGQVDAMSLGIARSLAEMSDDYHKLLRKEGLLTRDPRMVERKKYFFIKARKKPTYSKR